MKIQILGLSATLVGALVVSVGADAANLQVKLVASDYNAGTGVWTDTSGNGNDATRSGSATLNAGSTPTGQDAVGFSGAGSFSLNLAAIQTDLNTNGGEGFIVVRKSVNSWDGDTSSRGNSGLWDFGTNGSGIHYTWADGKVYDSFGRDQRPGSTDVRTVNGGYDTTQWLVYNIRSSGAGMVSLIDNQQILSTSSGNVSFGTNPTIGSGNGFAFDGEVAEVRLYEGVLTSNERDAVYNGLVNTYVVPEPTSLALLGLGGLLIARRRR